MNSTRKIMCVKSYKTPVRKASVRNLILLIAIWYLKSTLRKSSIDHWARLTGRQLPPGVFEQFQFVGQITSGPSPPSFMRGARACA